MNLLVIGFCYPKYTIGVIQLAKNIEKILLPNMYRGWDR